MNGPSGHEIKWTIKVPRGVAVDLRTINGGVQMTALEGEVRARSTNGGITGVALVTTSVDAAVTNGGVEIELAKADCRGQFRPRGRQRRRDHPAAGGQQRPTSPAAASTAGSRPSRSALETVGEQTRRRLEGKLNGGGARISLETVNGGVRIPRSGAEPEHQGCHAPCVRYAERRRWATKTSPPAIIG